MYDIRMHLPQRLENFLNVVENSGSKEQFDAVLDDIKIIVDDPGFIQDIRDYEQEYEKHVKSENKTALESIKKASNGNNIDQVIEDISAAIKQYDGRMQELTEDYVDTIKTYIFGYMPQIKITGYE